MTAPKKKVDPAAEIARLLAPAEEAGEGDPASDLTVAGLRTFFDLVSRTDRNRPDPSDLLALEGALIANPGIWRSVADLASRAVDLMIDQLHPTPAVRVSLRRGADELRVALAGTGASPSSPPLPNRSPSAGSVSASSRSGSSTPPPPPTPSPSASGKAASPAPNTATSPPANPSPASAASPPAPPSSSRSTSPASKSTSPVPTPLRSNLQSSIFNLSYTSSTRR